MHRWRVVPEPESGFGIGLRLCLALLPRSPRQSLPSVPALRPFPLSAVAAFPERLVVSDRPQVLCKLTDLISTDVLATLTPLSSRDADIIVVF
jgi:hypothetical protein